MYHLLVSCGARIFARVPLGLRTNSEGNSAMEFSYEMISKWFDGYFEQVRRNQGDLEKVPNLKKYFTSDFEFLMHTAPAQASNKPMSRDALLMSFVHPGLQEEILPRTYVIDSRQMRVAVQFEIRFRDEPSGKNWAPIQASAH